LIVFGQNIRREIFIAGKCGYPYVYKSTAGMKAMFVGLGISEYINWNLPY
jgi:hypothetical protein